MFSYNYLLMQNSRYATDCSELTRLCRERNVAVQTIKSVARRPWWSRPKTYNTYFYEPLQTQDAIDKAVHWALGFPDSFVVTAGDLQILPRVLDAADRFEKRPSDEEMRAMVDKFDMQQIFQPAPRVRGRGKGPYTWGGQASQLLRELIHEGFFKHPNGRSLEDVVRALESKGLVTKNKEDNISNILAGRVKKGVLKKSKDSNKWVYWKE
jgi:hypothetical protein